MRSKFEAASAKIAELVGDGETLADACERVGVEAHTGYNWASTGRRNPGGKYGKFAEAIDAARSTRLDREEEDDFEPGPVERGVCALIAGRALDSSGHIAACQARALSRQVDTLAASRSGSAALGLTAVSRRLDDVLVSLRLQPEDEVTRIGEARRVRLAAAGIPVASGNGVAA